MPRISDALPPGPTDRETAPHRSDDIAGRLELLATPRLTEHDRQIARRNLAAIALERHPSRADAEAWLRDILDHLGLRERGTPPRTGRRRTQGITNLRASP